MTLGFSTFISLFSEPKHSNYIVIYIKMPKPKRSYWNCVTVVSEKPPRVKCNLCSHEFPGTGTRIQVASSSACERCWSVYDFIHSARRNRLAPERAEKPVSIYMNMRLVEEASSFSFEERFVEWVEGNGDE